MIYNLDKSALFFCMLSKGKTDSTEIIKQNHFDHSTQPRDTRAPWERQLTQRDCADTKGNILHWWSPLLNNCLGLQLRHAAQTYDLLLGLTAPLFWVQFHATC